jgi:cysteine desulfurase/selenocysteine lyase
MSLSQDLTPRNLFPIAEKVVYFNHASTGPMSIPARKAIEECMNIYSSRAEFDLDAYYERINQARRTVARLIGADSNEITFTHNTSEGIYIALINLSLQPGDKLLIMDEVFPAVRYVVDHNLPQFVKQYVSFSKRDPVEVIKKNLDKNVRAVVVDHVQYLSGEMIDLKSLSDYLRNKDIYLVVDGIQAVGALDFNVREIEVDFLACGAAKWLFGPSGAGFLFVNRKNFDSLKKFHTGWLGADWGDFQDCELRPSLYNDARMFEQGTRNLIGISAFSENVKILLEFGMKHVEKQIMALKHALKNKFKALKYEIVTPENTHQSGIISVKPENARFIFNRLKENKVVISLRSNCLRFSPHFYNTTEEVEKISSILTRY